MKICYIVFLAFFGFVASASASDEFYSNQYNTCMDKSGGITANMQTCIGQEASRQDARLNKAYNKLVSELSASRKKTLLMAQRLWIQFRDSNCGFYGDPDGGTIAMINQASCGLKMTSERARELEGFAE